MNSMFYKAKKNDKYQLFKNTNCPEKKIKEKNYVLLYSPTLY